MKIEFNVPSIVCEGCVNVVTSAISQADIKAAVSINLQTKKVTVHTENQDSNIQDKIRKAIVEAGHEVA